MHFNQSISKMRFSVFPNQFFKQIILNYCMNILKYKLGHLWFVSSLASSKHFWTICSLYDVKAFYSCIYSLKDQHTDLSKGYILDFENTTLFTGEVLHQEDCDTKVLLSRVCKNYVRCRHHTCVNLERAGVGHTVHQYIWVNLKIPVFY